MWCPLPVHQLKEVCLCVFNVRGSDWSVGCQVTLDCAVTGGRESYSDPSHITLQPWNLPQYWTRPFIVCQRSLYQDFAFLLNGSNTIVWTVSQHLVSQTTTCQIYSTPATHNECRAQWVNRGVMWDVVSTVVKSLNMRKIIVLHLTNGPQCVG